MVQEIAPRCDIRHLRDLARQVAEIAAKPVQDERRRLWRAHNSLVRTRPLVVVTGVFFWHELALEESLQCRDPFLRQHESALLKTVYMDRLNDDSIVEPWVKVQAVPATPCDTLRWGLEIRRTRIAAPGGSWLFVPSLVEESDFQKMVGYDHVIDERATAERLAKVQDAIGDILQVALSRTPEYRGGHGDISQDLTCLRGLEQLMWDMVDRPQWLRRVCQFMGQAILRQHDQAEQAGDWRLIDSFNQSMPYCRELPDPVADGPPVGRDKLWLSIAAQEMAQVSPEMHEEFILQYQLPAIRRFGLVSYGCCEDLTRKIDMLRQVPNLRRIAVTPFADVRACAEQIAGDYVLSWRPSPAEMICNGFAPRRVRRIIREGLSAAKGCHVDITLKDVQTIAGNFPNLIEWVRIARQSIEEYA